MTYHAGDYDIAVIGAGHAGIEAALAAARMGASVLCFTINLDAVGNLPCNPSIGGTAKGCLVREIDALGGEMAKAADACCIQFRMLNRSRGPAVRAPRAQADRRRYQSYMKHVLERQPNLWLKQAEITEIETEDGRVTGVVTSLGAHYAVKAVVIASGTFLGGRVIVGDREKASGPDGLFAATELACSLHKIGISLRRFKTGTPPRVNARSLDFSKMQPQHGEVDLAPFSFSTPALPENKAMCYLTYTTEETHRLIRENLHRSPLYSGTIIGVGPRYCPSIEDKVVRFADKTRHPVFVEPTGLETEELYLQGLSSSLPEDVQIALVRTVPGLYKAEFMRPAYAIEYDCADPLDFQATLEHKRISGLFGAGQFLGTSGYEEAAGMGLLAGINATYYTTNKQQIVLERSGSYIGTLIDDLVLKGTNEPYRMMTSRSEYRLLLRQDNADQRLMPLGHEVGLVPTERLRRMEAKYAAAEEEIRRIKTVMVPADARLFAISDACGTARPEQKTALYTLLKRPELTYEALAAVDLERPLLPDDVAEQVEIQVRYEGYIQRQLRDAEELRRTERRKIPRTIDYSAVEGLSNEARQKFEQIRPESVGAALRISGVSPADATALLIHLEMLGRRKTDD
ncbi:tRNA uridine-5-carboxymethylaminomethyl(34) synthesis enzyme MnmG [Oscillospiraceae bacterium OttesenSCG-928-F05]|nr:tRNA uridine-5-carboxymethylaminomethyl(34) synthesis enzyme MnmG [Oscillospiraceae bacterium OttesenSCG-928-F05]